MTRRRQLGLVLVLALLLLKACASPAATPSPSPTATATPNPTPTPAPTPVPVPEGGIAIYFDDVRFVAEVADTPELRAQGLSGRPSMADHEGMWFDFGGDVDTAFWMRGMHFPLDIIWIDSDLTVVVVTPDVPAPPPGTPDAELPTYDSGGIPVRYVLEINAGLAERHGIGPGAQARLAEQ